MLHCIVCNKSLKLSDGNSFTLDASYALTFALGLLRAYSTAHCGKRRRLGNNVVSLLDITFLDLLDKSGNIDGYGTSLHALCILAVKTS